MMRYDSYKHLLIEIENGVAQVTLNRPDHRNAIHRPMIEELRTIWPVLGSDPDVRSILLTGAGKAFCVGGDVKQMGDKEGDFGKGAGVADLSHNQKIIHGLLDLDKPVVCAINGDAVGLGASLALLCDITVAAEEARIGDTHVKVGLVAGDGGVLIWPLLLGINKAKECLMRGLLLSAHDAERMGLVNHVVPQGDCLAKAREIAQELADGASWAIRWTKLAINQTLKERANLSGFTALALEHITMHTADHREAALAFKEKRKPTFTGT